MDSFRMSQNTPKAPHTNNPAHPMAGVAILMGALACFACMDASAKWLGQSLPALQIAGMRYLVSLVAVLFFLNPWSKPGILQTRKPGLQCLRGVFLIGMTIGCFLALRFLPLTQVTAICFAAPLITALLAGPMLGERIGPRRLVAVFLGFAGVLVITRPFNGSFETAVLIAGGAALANAFYFLTTRMLASNDKPETTMLYTSVVGTVLVSPVLIFTWTPPASPLVWAVLIGLGLFGAIGHWLLILAHRHAPASSLAPFFYAQIIGSIVFGFFIFSELPDTWTLLGSSLVIGSGLYLVYRERVRHKVPSTDISA